MVVFPSVRERCAFLRRPPRVIPRTRRGLAGAGKGEVTSFVQHENSRVGCDRCGVASGGNRAGVLGCRDSHKIQGTGMTNCQRKVLVYCAQFGILTHLGRISS